ncbi:DNA-binding transcriptional LysR family regulator [Cricetibacter osteomyelitidis]|uniref:DNA-binding transcriptional LysR family regulator n=1 Tax=Cricetibacter osteomyelitidis TaxID=1521931 RepID=A0A4R2T7W2_9PAST|nr:LysR family transcriptional regulator [Cricetibacter osteomyelitidis]TCP93258.1 DNA-binding transcriptional LysR family regulator [Cricetibacter osteomyelitidis]
MELRQLKQFCIIAQSDTLTQAAEKLFISQPALSTSLKNLEIELGVSLFDRKKNAIKLNKNGEKALQYAQTVLAKADEMQDYFRQLASNRHSLRLAFCDAGPMWYLMPHFALLPEDYAVKNSRFADSENGLQLLLDGSQDIVISSQPLLHEHIISREILSDQALLSVPKHHPLATYNTLCLNDIPPYTVLQLNVKGHFLAQITAYFHRHQLELPIEYEDDFINFQQRLTYSDSLSFSSRLAQTYRNDGGKRLLIPLTDEACYIRYYVNYLHNNSKTLEKVLRVMEEA